MSTETKTARRPARKRRDELLDLAAEMFAQQGYAQCSMRDLAERAEITPGSLYHYFSNKSEIVEVLVDRYWSATFHAYDVEEQAASDALGRVLGLIRASMTATAAQRNEAIILHQDWHNLRLILPRLEGQWETAAEHWRNAIQAAIDEGSLRSDVSSAMIYRTIVGSLSWVPRWMDPAGPLSAEDIAAAMQAIFATGVRGTSVPD
jgi:AcrR family transcriptional regulator